MGNRAPLTQVQDLDEIVIGGRWTKATGEPAFIVDPSTGEQVATIREASTADMAAAVDAAYAAFHGEWSTWSVEQRAEAMEAIAEGLEARIDALSTIGSTEYGAPGAFSTRSQGRAATVLRYFADMIRSYQFREDRIRSTGQVTRVVREPVGVVAAIVPWNGALATAGLKLGAALGAGCTVVLKPPVEAPFTCLVLGDVVADLVEQGRLPEGVVSVVPAGLEASQALVANPRVDKISFTGSTVGGRDIMAKAAERIARVTLELGGKSAAIILDDAPIDAVFPILVFGGCGNTGQMCFGLTRVLVTKNRKSEIIEEFSAALATQVVGSAHDPAVGIGPLATAKQYDRVKGYIDLAVSEGARVVFGGGRPEGVPDGGFYIQPTLLDGVTNDMRIAREEVFGPVISLIEYEDEDDAIRIANDSIYGLNGAVFTADPEHGYDVARRIEAGMVTVNGFVWDYTMPFGGYKQSGVGKEGAAEGLEGFLEVKSVHMPA